MTVTDGPGGIEEKVTLGENGRIKTPWKQQWKRVRHQLVPVVVFAVALLACVYLWGRHFGTPVATGEVKVAQAAVSTPTTGVLSRLPREGLDPMDYVEEGQVLARLDDREVRVELGELRAAIARVKGELAREQGAARAGSGEGLRVESIRLNVLDYRAAILEGRLEMARTASGDGELQRGVQKHQQAVEAGMKQLSGVQRSGPESESLAAAVDALEAALNAVELKAQGLEIRAPYAGVVSAVHKVPGQTVLAGEPIVTVTRLSSRYVIAYLRQEQRIRPAVDEEVTLRRRYNGGKGTAARVAKVGQHLETIPLQQLRDPRTPEWGLPVLIEIPIGFEAKPGELVDIRFTSRVRG